MRQCELRLEAKDIGHETWMEYRIDIIAGNITTQIYRGCESIEADLALQLARKVANSLGVEVLETCLSDEYETVISA